MIQRPFWHKQIEVAWKKRPIVWLSGVRRAGKTTLVKRLDQTHYVNCDLPSSVKQLADPEAFYNDLPHGTRIVLDEVHRLPDPSLTLKIAADQFPHLRVLATGSSTLAATAKFRDSLTGRKTMIYLPPVLWTESALFGADLHKRLFRGGLPELLMAPQPTSEFYSEWMDSFYARDVQELFGIRNRTGFLALLRLLALQSGGMVDYTRLSSDCGLSRPTVIAHLEAMSIAHAVFLLRPFSGGGKREITGRPKAYLFDTGFVVHANGWSELRDGESGTLWEHLVLDVLRVTEDPARIGYWHDKSDREIDFVITRGKDTVDAIECKLDPDRAGGNALKEFRSIYPHGRNFVISPHIPKPYSRKSGTHKLECLGLDAWISSKSGE
jgi:predicted AAA+ superfamily ATPase